MIIIKVGNKLDEISTTETCPECDTVFSHTDKEIILPIYYTGISNNDDDVVPTVRCPACGNYMEVVIKDINYIERYFNSR